MDGKTSSGRTSQVLPEEFVERMRAKTDAALRQVMEAVNVAPDGAWINASEIPVRDVFAELRREAYETALQMRLDAAEGAFSPGGPSQRQAAGKQRRRAAQLPERQWAVRPVA